MRSLSVWLFFVLVLLIAGCGLHSEEPLGVVKPLKPEEWNGNWLIAVDKEASVIEVEVIDAEKAIISGRDPCKPVAARDGEGVLLLLRSAEGGWYFPVELERDAQGQPKEKGPPFEYMFFYLRPSAGLWFGYGVDRDRVKVLIETGVLPGRIEGDTSSPSPPGVIEGDPIMRALQAGSYDVILGHLEPEHYKALLSEERPVVFWQRPMTVGVKLPPGLDPCKKAAHDS